METIAFLLSDGITNGALYGLVALSLILVCTVTRVVNIAQGEYVVLGAFSFASSLNGEFCSLSYLVVGAILVLTVGDVFAGAKSGAEKSRLVGLRAAWVFGLLAVNALAVYMPGTYGLAALAAIFTTASIGPIVYRLTVEPNPEASPVFLLIVSLGVYLVLHSVAVLLWGAEAQFVPVIVDGGVSLGSVFITYQSLAICVTSLLIMLALYGFSRWTLIGQALQAVAVNRVGAQLCGIPVRSCL
jgi:branched-chain amino acid transport system permease protein